MSSFVSSILYHSANKTDDGVRSKWSSAPVSSGSASGGGSGSPGFAPHMAVHPSVSQTNNNMYYAQQHRAAEYMTPSPPPYDTMVHASPTPTPSTSWTSEMNFLADRIRDDTASVASSKQVYNLDRRSISQGLKLVSIAADEFDEGNEEVALDIYLTGLDKILMALPNKTDPKTKAALRDKLLSVEERVGILNIASQENHRLHQHALDDATLETEEGTQDVTTFLRSYIFSRISTTLGRITHHTDTLDAAQHDALSNNREPCPSPTSSSARDSVNRFKRLGQFLIHIAVTLAVAIKQSPIPDILYFLFGYFFQLLLWLDAQYHIVERIQAFAIDCVKFLLQAEEEYRVHEFVSEAMYVLVTAGLKAAVAFKEAPSYRQQQKKQRYTAPPHSYKQQHNTVYCEEAISPANPTPRSRIAWTWSPW